MVSESNAQSGASRPRAPSWHLLAAFCLPILLLAPFAGKAYNFDDPAFLWVAQQIRTEPLNFFGFEVDQGYKRTPMNAFNHNPPGVSYYLAFLSLFFGWNEAPLHLGMDLFAGFGAVGLYLLARRLCPRPLLVTVLAIVTPAFLVSASSVMTDIPMAAFYVWAVYAWVVGLKEKRTGWLLAAGVLAAVSTLCKYYGITLVPLLFAYGVVKRRGVGAWSFHLLIPVAALAAFQVWTWRLYGTANLFDAVGVALNERFRVEEGRFFRPLDVLTFLGGTFAPLALYAPFVYRWRTLAVGGAAVTILMIPFIEGYSIVQLMMGVAEPFSWVTGLHVGLMLAAGVFVVSLMIPEIYRRHDAESALLTFWFVGTLVFAIGINHFVDTRVLLPALPAAVIVLGRALPRARVDEPVSRWGSRVWWPVLPAALFSIWILGGDYVASNHARDAAIRAAQLAHEEDTPLYFSGFGAFHYYSARSGGKPFDAESRGMGAPPVPKMQHGELLAVDSEGREGWRTPPAQMEPAAIYRYTNPLGVTTYHPLLETGFYNHMGGFLPYVVGRIPPEEFGVYRWTGPSYRAGSGG